MLSNKKQPQIIVKTRKTIDKLNLLKRGDNVLVAFSGGPDSCALLYLLFELKKEYGISLCAGHINHMLRDKESSEDEKWVKKTCKDLKIPCKTKKKDIKKLKKKGESLEEAARRIRYKALEEITRKFGANKIAFGHNRNDQVETVLFRIIRGTGEDGLGGIPAVRQLNADIKLIRPLIDVGRKEIERYLESEKINYRIDSSNLDVKFLRNKIRHELIPYLEKFNPKIQEGLVKVSQISRENSEYIKQNTQQILERISTRMPDAIKMDIKKLMAYPHILRNNILREFAGRFKELNYANLKEIEKIIKSKKANLSLYLSPKVKVIKEYANLIIKKVENLEKSTNARAFYYIFKEDGKFHIPEIKKNIHIDIRQKSSRTPLKFEDARQIYLDADKVKFPLILRTRQKGDRFCPFGMNKEKKLKDFFIDEKIPLAKRDKIPILVSGDSRILWIVGCRRGNPGKITPKTRKIMSITLKKE